MNAIETISLTKRYGDVTAVDDVSFTIPEGEIFGFLGPNGAGKSTTMMILTTLLKPTSGRALVAGFDVVKQASQVRKSIGYVQQDISVDEFLTGRENLILQARLNHIPKNIMNRRIDEILELIELTDKQDEAVVTYSGGMRKRLDIAGGLLHMPKVLFLDEPTVGLDIQTRRKIWDYIKKIHQEYGITIFLSTHYMEEADNLCNRVGIIDYGKIQAIDSPANMKKALGNEIVVFKAEPNKFSETVSELESLDHVKKVTVNQDSITVFTARATELIPKIFQLTDRLQTKITSLSLMQPTLDDVFLSYTGHDLRDGPSSYNRKKEFFKMRRLRT